MLREDLDSVQELRVPALVATSVHVWRRIAAAGVALVAASAVAPQSVQARSFVTLPSKGASAPVLLGDTLAWRGPLGDPVIHGDDGTGPREIGRLPSGLEYAGIAPGSGSEPIVLGGSAELVVVNHPHRCYSEACESVEVIARDTYTTVYAGRRGSPLPCLGGPMPLCSSRDPTPEGFASVSGSVIAWPVDTAEQPSFPQRTFVRDLGPGAALPDRATIDLQDGRANGTWVAGVIAVTEENKATDVVVMNWRTHGVALHIPGLTSARVLSVEPNGTVVYTTKAGEDRLAVFAASSDRPVARLITTTRNDTSAVSAGGRVVRLTHEQDLSWRRTTRPPASGIVEAFDLEGSRVARADEPALFGGFDSDGQRVLLVSKPCYVARYVVQELGAPPVARPQGRCPAARVVGALRWRGPSARLRIACTGATKLGCFGRVRLVATARVGNRSLRRFIGQATYALPGAARRRLRVYVKPSRRRFLRAHPGARVTVTSVGGVPRGSHARPRTRTTGLRLPRP